MSYDLFAEYYDELMSEVDYPARAKYIDAIIKRCKPDAHLLVDLACGTGSMTVEFSAMGYDVIGVDLSENMLSKAREKSDGSILYLCQSMQALDMYGTIDAFVCTLDSLNHIEGREQLLLALGRVSLFLEPDGVFVFDMNTPYKHEKILADNAFVYETEDVYCVWQNQNVGDGKVEIALDFFEQQPDGSYIRECEDFCEVAYSVEETEQLLRQAGLKLLAAYDDMTLDNPRDDSERIVYVCGKE